MSRTLSEVMDTPKPELARMFLNASKRVGSLTTKVREKGEIVGERVTTTLLSSAAGYGVGVLRNKMGSGVDKRVMIPGVNVDLTLWGPAALQVLGIAGLAGKSTDKVLAVANGASAAHWGIEGFLNGLPGESR